MITLQCPSSLKQINFKMECFSSLSDKPSIYYKYRGDLLQHSVVNQNEETRPRNSRAVALSTHARLLLNSSMSSLVGAFDSSTVRDIYGILDVVQEVMKFDPAPVLNTATQ